MIFPLTLLDYIGNVLDIGQEILKESGIYSMSYVVVNLSLFVVIFTARQSFLFCNKVIKLKNKENNNIIINQ
jgi:hypothetical protein